MISKLINQSITSKEYSLLIGYLINIIRKTAIKYNIPSPYWEENIEDIANEIILNIINKALLWRKILTQKDCKGYLYITIRNYLLDIYRKRERIKSERLFYQFIDSEGKEVSEEDILPSEDYRSEISEELIDLIEDFKNKIGKDEIKYFCYFLLPNGKKLYKCLWGNKSKDAIYQDAKRKRDKVVIPLLEEWARLGVERETVELFIKTHLSEICEKLRSFYCREEK
jgi:DNA-directed RNA polymerase specialized sigma24 family protein